MITPTSIVCLLLGHQVAPSFEKSSEAGADSEGGRGSVYDFYLKYEAWKAELAAYDVMDACYSIYQARLVGVVAIHACCSL